MSDQTRSIAVSVECFCISKEDKILIDSFYETKGYGTRKLLKQFPQKNWTKGSSDSLIMC